MHVHYTGWRQENNYVPMNFDGRLGAGSGAGDGGSLSFDSQNGVPGSRDPFAPASLTSVNHYEIQVVDGDQRQRYGNLNCNRLRVAN